MVRYFAIKQISTGKFLPEMAGKQRDWRGGYTHSEPKDPRVWPPRLFHKRQYAQSALKWWLEGRTTIRGYQSFDGSYDEDWHTEKVPERDPSDMEIVEMALIEVGTRALIRKSIWVGNA